MNRVTFALVLSGVLLNAGAQLLLKAGATRLGDPGFHEGAFAFGLKLATQPHILVGLACYAVSVVVWILALAKVEVSVAYPMLSLGYVVNAVAAWWLFGESITAGRVGGMAFILVGVYLMGRSA